MENIFIRKVKEDDIPEVVDIRIVGWQTAYKGIIAEEYLQNMNRQERIEKRKRDYKQNGFIVAEIENEIVGFCRYIDSNVMTPQISDIDCELTAIYVKPEYKRNGIGRKMFEYVTDEFRQKGRKKMILWCLKNNEPSKKFYEKMGGKVVSEKNIKIGEKDYLEVGFCYELL